MLRASRMAILIITVLAVFFLSEVVPVSAGYWQLQNEPQITFGPDNLTREWMAQGKKAQIVDFSARHVLVTMSGMVGGGFNTMSWRAEWSPPDKIFPGEIVSVSVKATCTNVSYERSQWPFSFEVPLVQWNGLGGPTLILANEDHRATASGATISKSNSSFKAPVPSATGGEARLKFGITTNYSYGFQVQFRYIWVAEESKTPSAFYDLSGRWGTYAPNNGTNDGTGFIEQNGQDILLTNEFGGKSRAAFQDPLTIVCVDWVHPNGTKLIGRLVPAQGRINWDNGSWWLKKQGGLVCSDYLMPAGKP